ncbi:MAG: hypothetical protein H0Z34_02450 [Brevibacillus sp.]|nr:hypothetical protein [Brevibacillus sp.]
MRETSVPWELCPLEGAGEKHVVEGARNAPRAVALCQQYMRMLSILRINGIPILPIERQNPQRAHKAAPSRRYRVQLYQHHVLCLLQANVHSVWLHQQVERSERVHFTDITELPEEPEHKRVKQLAVRSLYALGLDSGVVSLGAHSPNRIYVLDVEPAPTAEEKGSPYGYQKVVEHFRQLKADQEKRQNDIWLGADPEFALRDVAGNLGVASRFLPKRGTVGCDAARLRTTPYSQELPLVELRPQPSPDPDLLFVNMYRALRRAADKITDRTLEWIAGGMPFPGYPIGGHLHFSGVPLSFSLIRALDTYLTLPLALVEDEGCRKRRPRYGFLGDFRPQPHGGFEYRTPPSWLVTPTITRGVFSLAKLIAQSYPMLTQQPLAAPAIQRAYYDGVTSRLYGIVKGLYAELRELPLYGRYRHAIEPLFAYLLSETVWPADADFRPAWSLASSLQQRHAGVL